jgi:RNA polymerase sigma-54 factor
LDDRGFIDRPMASIADDLLFHFNIDADLAEVEEAMKILQQFEPAGIGARNLQECLTIQLDRKLENCSD